MNLFNPKFWSRNYLDLWTIPHFLFGVLFALYAIIEGLDINNAFILLNILAILWEIFEYRFKFKEHVTNRIVDVVIAMVGFLMVVQLDRYLVFDIQTFNIILTTYILTNLIGWAGYQTSRMT